MLAGLGARWKQIVRYDFAGDSVNGIYLKPVVNIILKAESISFRLSPCICVVVIAQRSSLTHLGLNYAAHSGRYILKFLLTAKCTLEVRE